MRKRKPPIIPVTILCVCVAVAFGYNYKAGINPNAAQAAPPPAPDAKDAPLSPRATQSVDKVAAGVKGLLGTPPAAAADSSGPPKRSPMANKGNPTIEVSHMANQKPVPNDTSVSSQWYQPDSSRSGQ